jgi:4-amino-4-deoxy-L-arabinose transferase-like glycosyltransferase
MLQTGDYLVTSYQGEHYLDKPPLSLWILALSYRLFGISVFSARLPSALAGLATILIVGKWAMRRSGPFAGWLSALILMFSFEFVFVAMTFAADAFLTLAVVVAILVLDAAARRQDGRPASWGAACGTSLALAFGFKGLVGLVLPIGIVAASMLLDHCRPRQPLRRAAWTVFFFVVLVAPWHVAMTYRLGMEFWDVFYWKNQFLRGATGSYMRAPKSPFYYLEVLAWAIFPWSLQLASPARRAGPTRLPLAWLLFGVAFWSALAMKREVYLVPVLPAASVLVAEGLASERKPARWPRRAAWFLAAAVACAGALLWIRGFRSIAVLAGTGSTIFVWMALLAFAAVLCSAALWPGSQRTALVTALSCGLLCLALSVLDEHLGRFDPLPAWGARVRSECTEGCDTFLLGPRATSLAFYSHMDWVFFSEPLNRLPAFLHRRKGFLLMLTSWEPRLAGLSLRWEVVDRRTDIGKHSADLLFHPQEALEELSLVRIEVLSDAPTDRAVGAR